MMILVDVLMLQAGDPPAQKNRRALPLDAPLLEDREQGDARIKYRLGQHIEINYSVLQD